MAKDRFMIGYTDNNSGLQTNVRPWLLPDNAFARLENAYVFRGRVRKRFGSTLMGDSQLNSRLRINIGTTAAVSGDFTTTVPGATFKEGQMFSIGDTIFTVYQTGTPAAMYSTGTAIGTYDTTNGQVVIIGNTENPATDVYFYPAEPVMGITQYEQKEVSNEITIAFDTQFSYYFNVISNFWERRGLSTWTGSDSQFFWSTNYYGATPDINLLWVTNYKATDGIRYLNDSTWTTPVLNYAVDEIGTTDAVGNAAGAVAIGSGFIGQIFIIGSTCFKVIAAVGALEVSSLTSAAPVGTGTFDIATGAYTFTGASTSTKIYYSDRNIVNTARIIIPFKNRLVLLNTIENVSGTQVRFVNRCRYCGTSSPLDVASWLQSIPGNGGFVDPATSEAIVTAQLLKDRLIVYFERSTWELVYTGNQIQPFVWQKINTELGAESTFSQVPFDKVVLGIGNSGIHACTGTNVDRIDNKIPDLVFSFHNQNQGVDRVAGIRDYNTEMVYWTFPSDTRTSTEPYPDKVLVYNYINNSWAINHDSFTAFGYYQLSDKTPELTWGDAESTWGETELRWGGIFSGYVGRTRRIVAGNQEGFVVIINPDISRNAPSLQVTDCDGHYQYTVIDHNLKVGEYVKLSSESIATWVTSVIDKDTVTLALDYSGAYTGGVTLSRVSKIDIRTKEYNFYVNSGRNAYMSQVSFFVDKITDGQITIDYYISSASGFSLAAEGSATGTLLGSVTLNLDAYDLAPFEEMQERVWHSMYTQAEGECVQLRIYYSPYQMVNRGQDPFTLHAMILYTQPTTIQLQS